MKTCNMDWKKDTMNLNMAIMKQGPELLYPFLSS